MIRNYYIRFIADTKVNYLYLFSLMRLARYDKESKSFSLVQYDSIAQLSRSLSIPRNTLTRFLKNPACGDYFTVDESNKTIKLYNSFIGRATPFIILTAKELDYLIQQQDNLLCRYFIYVKYYCGYTHNNTNFTIAQFLAQSGYSTTANNYVSRISEYNSLLVKAGFIKIIKSRQDGRERNNYVFL